MLNLPDPMTWWVVVGKLKEGLTSQMNALSAAGKVAVVAGFLQAPEFRGDYVTSLYTSYTSLPGDSFFGAVPNLLCRPVPPAPTEVASWVNSGLNMQQIAVFMSASSEFFSDR